LNILLLAALLAPLATAESLDALLARMTKAAPGAVSFSATVKQLDYLAVVSQTDESNGSIRLKRTKAGVIGVMDYTSPSPNTVHFTGGNMEKYLPKANLLEIYDYGKYSKSVDQYLSLAFGVSGADLQKSYGVKWGGEESLGAVRVTRLELTPKDKDALKLITKIELWIPEGQTYTIQEKLYKAGGKDTLTWIYSDAKLNPALPDAAFDFKPPPGAQRRVMK
jgi:outer membrane lipoprotein-sorting protein